MSCITNHLSPVMFIISLFQLKCKVKNTHFLLRTAGPQKKGQRNRHCAFLQRNLNQLHLFPDGKRSVCPLSNSETLQIIIKDNNPEHFQTDSRCARIWALLLIFFHFDPHNSNILLLLLSYFSRVRLCVTP